MKSIKTLVNDQIATITLNRPEKLNALNQTLLEELESELHQIATSNSRGLIIKGAGPKAFSAGADLKEMSQFTTSEFSEFSSLANRVLNRIEDLPIPTIAQIDGLALGGGSELALSCDFIYATASSQLGQPEVGIGLIPGFGGCVRLARRIGESRAKHLIFSGLSVKAPQAKEFGLVDLVFNDESDLEQAIQIFFKKIVQNSANGISLSKIAIQKARSLDRKAALAIERSAYLESFQHPHGQEGVDSFLNKRPAQFGH